MAGGYLRLRFQDDGDGTGELRVLAEAEGFSGQGAAYFNIGELEEFAKALAVFPLPLEDKRRSIAGGFWSEERRGELDQEHLGISVYPADARRGYIGIQVRMATPAWQGTRPQSKEHVVVEIVTTYQPLSQFSRDLLAVLNGSIKEALLEGE
jgi:hypothetical protein